jgi:hypothetical protein
MDRILLPKIDYAWNNYGNLISIWFISRRLNRFILKQTNKDAWLFKYFKLQDYGLSSDFNLDLISSCGLITVIRKEQLEIKPKRKPVPRETKKHLHDIASKIEDINK